jgi:hypothetical protein
MFDPTKPKKINMLGSKKDGSEDNDREYRKVRTHGRQGCQLACALGYLHHEYENEGPHTMTTYLVYCLARAVWMKPLTLESVGSQRYVHDIVSQRFFIAADIIKDHTTISKKLNRNREKIMMEASKKIDQITTMFLETLHDPKWQQQNMQRMTPAQFINRLDRVMSNKRYFWDNNFVLGGSHKERAATTNADGTSNAKMVVHATTNADGTSNAELVDETKNDDFLDNMITI